ncbi:MAG: peptidylprolyl isomerase, partial [bacterium]
MKLACNKLTLFFIGSLVIFCHYCAQGRSEEKKSEDKPAVEAAAEPNIVAQIADYVITEEELEQRLMNELRPDDQYSEKDQPVDARTVLMKMIAEKAMVIEARKQGYLQDEQIQASIKRFKERMLINLCLGRYFKGKQNEMAVTDAEIDKKLKRDPKMDRKRAIALLQREKGNRLFDQYYNQLCKKFHVRKVSRNFPKAAKIHQRLLNHPKEPRKMWWIQSRQIRDELTPEEKDIVLATYDNGKVTLKDWFYTLSDIAPPGRPKDLNTPQGVERLLDRPLRMAVLVAEAGSLGLDKDKNFIKQVRLREDSMLLGKAVREKVKDIKNPTDQQIVAYFEKNKQAFGTPKMLKIDQIWCQDLKTARKAKAELENGKDFKAVKPEYSLQKETEPFHTDPSSEGIFFEDLWKGDPNEIVGPVKGFYGDGVKWRIV